LGRERFYSMADPKSLILYHFRRSRIGEVESDTIEFSVVLEKDGKRIRVGQHYTEGTLHKPRDIFKLLDQGWQLVAVESCYKWAWNARRYIEDYKRSHRTEEDVYGRAFVMDLWLGWYDIVDVEGKGRFREKVFHNSETGNDKGIGKIPQEVQDLFEKTEWMEMAT
jgi:hypothetical protein